MAEDRLTRLSATVAARRGSDPEVSYVARLQAAGVARIAQKLGEEAVETVIAAVRGDAAATTAEAADLLFHLAVLLDALGSSFDDVLDVLEQREGMSGLAEKAARSGVTGAQRGDRT